MTNIRRPALLRPTLLVLATGLSLFAVLSARADADTFCVGMPAGAVCDTTSPNLQTQLDAAGTHPGHDTVKIGSATVSNPTGFAYNYPDDDNSVDIIGSGKGLTTIENTDPTGSMQALKLAGADGSTVQNLTIEIPDNPDGTDVDYGLDLGISHSPSALNIARNVEVTSQDTSNVWGIRCTACLVDQVDIDLPHGVDGNGGVLGNAGDSTVLDTTIDADVGMNQLDSGASLITKRTRVDASTGFTTDGGEFDIRDSLVELKQTAGAVGVSVLNGNGGGGQMGAVLDGVTILGQDTNMDLGTKGIRGEAKFASQTVDLDVSNTVITGTQNTFWLEANSDGTVNTQVKYSAINNAQTHNATGPMGGTVNHNIVGVGHIDLDGDPGFTDPANGDYTPVAASPLTDAGDPAAPPNEATDISGINRACDGDADGAIRRDIGAFELKDNPADDCTYPDTLIVSGPEPYPARYTSKTLEFKLASSKPGSTFRCWVDNPPEMPCGSAYTTPEGLSYGYHGFAARAIDAFGNVDQTPAAQTFGLDFHGPGPPRCFTDKALCPDITAPKVTKLKAPKKTKKKRVKVRFRSNEKKVIFTCKLNKRPAHRCKSPWKTPKLRRGKNLVRVWVTDSSGNKSGIKHRFVRRR